MNCEPQSEAQAKAPPDARSAAAPLSQDIVAMIAHELRNPLAVMSNVLKTCRTGNGSRAMPAAGDVLDRQVTRALRLVNDLMDLSRFTDERLQFDCAPVDMTRVVRNSVRDFQHALSARRQVLELELPPEVPWVAGDASRLEQIVGNLLENSCKYSPVDGQIRLTLSREGSQAVLSIRDDGAGIASDDLPHIFDAYFRGAGAAHRSQGGLGLGLTLARRLVQLHGGTIEASSPGAGCGSVFTVRLPAAVPHRD